MGSSAVVLGTTIGTTGIEGTLVSVGFSGGAAALWGSAGLFGTTIGATGIKGALMSAGLISATPVWVPIAVGGAAATSLGGAGYLLYQISKLKNKGASLRPGQEAQFTDQDAKLFEKILLALHKKGKLAD